MLLGLALGAVQPMIMSTLHHLTPHDRHGEAIALRSMAINLSSSVMPLVFGVAGAAIGAASLFWAMGAAVGGGQLAARHVGARRQNLMPAGAGGAGGGAAGSAGGGAAGRCGARRGVGLRARPAASAAGYW